MLCRFVHAFYLETPRSTMAERQTGTVKWFSNEKGYGFIVPEEGGEDLFVHYSEIDTDGFKSLDEDDRVEFSVGHTDKGPNAQDVVVIG
jgi:CspA family cold shock protein